MQNYPETLAYPRLLQIVRLKRLLKEGGRPRIIDCRRKKDADEFAKFIAFHRYWHYTWFHELDNPGDFEPAALRKRYKNFYGHIRGKRNCYRIGFWSRKNMAVAKGLATKAINNMKRDRTPEGNAFRKAMHRV